MSINTDCVYVLIGYHLSSSERNPFHIISVGAESRATKDSMRTLSGLLAFNFFLLWLHFQTKIFPLVTILTLPDSCWYPINWATQLEIKCIFFSKRSLADYWLCISLTKAGSYICPWTDNSVQFSSVTQLRPILCNPMNHSMPGFPVHHQLLEHTQTHASRVGDAIQPSHPLSPLFLLPSIFPNIRVFSNESILCVRWPKYWSFSFSISPSNEYSGLISFRMDWLDLPAVQGTLKSLLQHHSSKASILQCSAFFIVQLPHPYMTTGKTKALTKWTFVGKVMSLLFNMLSSWSQLFFQGASVS